MDRRKKFPFPHYLIISWRNEGLPPSYTQNSKAPTVPQAATVSLEGSALQGCLSLRVLPWWTEELASQRDFFLLDPHHWGSTGPRFKNR